MDSLIHVPVEDDVAKLPVQRRKGRNLAAMSLKIRPNKWLNLFKNFQKQMNAVHKW